MSHRPLRSRCPKTMSPIEGKRQTKTKCPIEGKRQADDTKKEKKKNREMSEEDLQRKTREIQRHGQTDKSETMIDKDRKRGDSEAEKRKIDFYLFQNLIFEYL